MNARGLILAGVTAAAILAGGGVVASALNDLPQDARPIDPARSGAGAVHACRHYSACRADRHHRREG
ncbi:MAG: hypothetical protein EON96_22865 [Caulobacteraceae bacterium]|nr:MAG: hypothetical protein EON96_22865 [Caulobacteraceae bacterium]